MKNKPFVVFFLLFCTSIFSQTGTISGKISDKNQLPLELVSVAVKKDSTVVNGTTSNEKGNFTLKNLPLSNLQLEVTYLGYQTQVKTIELSAEKPDKTIDFSLLENEQLLDEVSVTAKKTTIVQKVDKKVVNVGNDLISSGANAFELLQNTPFVIVDLQDQKITMRGSRNVKVFINGKPSNLDSSVALKQIPSNTVKQVELITNPSAKYTAEGMGGIINFILKKNKQYGFNGSVTMGIERSENTRPSLSTNMNYREGKVNFFGGYSIDLGKTNSYTGLYRTDKDLNQDLNFINDDTYHTFKIGADIYFNTKSVLSFYTNHAIDNADYFINSRVNENQLLSVNQNTYSKIYSHEQTYNLDYKFDIDVKGQNLEIDVTYITTKSPEDNIYSDIIDASDKTYNFFNKITNNNKTWLFNIDYVKPLTETSKIETGLDFRLFSTSNKILSDQELFSIPVGNNDLQYDRDIFASYATYHNEFGKFAIQGGLRFEYFLVDGVFENTVNGKITNDTYNDDVFNVYPSVFLTYFQSDNDEWYASYGRRVDRPSIEQITPIPDFATPLSISTGNQDLQPQYTNAFELNYTRYFKAGYASLGGIYRSTSDKVDRAVITNTLDPDFQTFSFVNNAEGTDQFGFEFYTEIELKKWWSTSLSANYYHQDRTGLVGTRIKNVKNNLFYTMLNNRFKATKKLSFQLNAFYSAKTKSPLYNIKPYGKVDFGAKLSVLQDKGAVNFRVNDIFETLKYRFSSVDPIPQTGFMNTELRTVYLGFTYNFGSGKNKARKRKERDKNETQSSGGVL